jgi:hypothetical protein
MRALYIRTVGRPLAMGQTSWRERPFDIEITYNYYIITTTATSHAGGLMASEAAKGRIAASLVFVRVAAGFALVVLALADAESPWGIACLAGVCAASLLNFYTNRYSPTSDNNSLLADAIYAALACAAFAVELDAWFWLPLLLLAVWLAGFYFWRYERASEWMGALAIATGAITAGFVVARDAGGSDAVAAALLCLVTLYLITVWLRVKNL